MDATELLRAVAVFASGIPAGLQVAVLAVFAPRTATLPEADALRTHDLLLHHAHHNLIGVLPSALAAACGTAVVIADGVDGLAGVTTLVGVAGLLGAALVTRFLAVPLNTRIRKRLRQATQTEYDKLSRQFIRTQWLRAGCGVLGFAALSVAAAAA
jgi:Domain of unknown function (DUF1772)